MSSFSKICESQIGWRGAFYIHTGLGFVLFFLWWLVYTDDPRECAHVTTRELTFIQKNKSKQHNEGATSVPYWVGHAGFIHGKISGNLHQSRSPLCVVLCICRIVRFYNVDLLCSHLLPYRSWLQHRNHGYFDWSSNIHSAACESDRSYCQ